MKRSLQKSQDLAQLLDPTGHVEISQSRRMSLMPFDLRQFQAGRQAAEGPELLGSTLHARQSLASERSMTLIDTWEENRKNGMLNFFVSVIEEIYAFE